MVSPPTKLTMPCMSHFFSFTSTDLATVTTVLRAAHRSNPLLVGFAFRRFVDGSRRRPPSQPYRDARGRVKTAGRGRAI
jgi:hypothetical protein